VIKTFGESISPLSNKEGEPKTEDVWLVIAPKLADRYSKTIKLDKTVPVNRFKCVGEALELYTKLYAESERQIIDYNI
jgi:hypothetical protein